MSFNSAGTFPVTIKQIEITPAKFLPNDPNAFDMMVLVESDDGQADWWRGECSTRHGVGNASDRTQTQLTTETLTKIGLLNGDLNQYMGLIGVKTVATVKTSSCGNYYNLKYLGGGGAYKVEPLDQAEGQRRMAAMLGGQQQQTQQFSQQGGQQQQQPNQQFNNQNGGQQQQGNFNQQPQQQQNPQFNQGGQQTQQQQGQPNLPNAGNGMVNPNGQFNQQ